MTPGRARGGRPAYPEFSDHLVRDLEPLPGFRNVLLHEYLALDMNRVVDALNRLGPLGEFAEGVRRIEGRS